MLRDGGGSPQAILIATGSEVGLAMQAAELLEAEGINARVVSMPCVEVFEAQDAGYRESVLPSHIRARIAVEAGYPDPWYKWVGIDGAVVGIDRFGLSGPGAAVLAELGMTAEAVVQATRRVLSNQEPQQV